jgi:hypothetical protein
MQLYKTWDTEILRLKKLINLKKDKIKSNLQVSVYKPNVIKKIC